MNFEILYRIMKTNVFLVMFLLRVAVIHGYDFQNTTDSSGIYLVKSLDTYVAFDQWRMVYYVDLEPFNIEVSELKTCVQKIKTLCQKVPKDEHCSHLVERFQKHLDNIDHNLAYIYSFRVDSQKRTKLSAGGFNLIGSYYIKPLFGLMDENDAI